jgi:hypothetical protein
MIRRSVHSRLAGLAFVALLTAGAHPAFAGPPLLCHPFDTGGAPSLPWDGVSSWFDVADGYDRSRLVSDTQALLTQSTPVIARMETLRRAAIYASADPHVARRLVSALVERTRLGETRRKSDALAYLDAAYAIEALRQVTHLAKMGQFAASSAAITDVVADLDGYALMRKALALRPADPALAFAAALVVADRNRNAYLAHARVARAGVKQDALLARNIKQVGY